MDAQTHAFLTVKDIMNRLRVCRATADKLLQEGAIRSIRVGRVIRIPVQALDAYIAAQMGRAS